MVETCTALYDLKISLCNEISTYFIFQWLPPSLALVDVALGVLDGWLNDHEPYAHDTPDLITDLKLGGTVHTVKESLLSCQDPITGRFYYLPEHKGAGLRTVGLHSTQQRFVPAGRVNGVLRALFPGSATADVLLHVPRPEEDGLCCTVLANGPQADSSEEGTYMVGLSPSAVAAAVIGVHVVLMKPGMVLVPTVDGKQALTPAGGRNIELLLGDCEHDGCAAYVRPFLMERYTWDADASIDLEHAAAGLRTSLVDLGGKDHSSKVQNMYRGLLALRAKEGFEGTRTGFIADLDTHCGLQPEILEKPATCIETAWNTGGQSVFQDLVACGGVTKPVTSEDCVAIKKSAQGSERDSACTYIAAVPMVPEVPYTEDTCTSFLTGDGGLGQLRDAMADITREGKLHPNGMRAGILAAAKWALVTYTHADSFHSMLPVGNPSRIMVEKAKPLIGMLLDDANDGEITDVMCRQHAYVFNKELQREAFVTEDAKKLCFGLPGLPRSYGANLMLEHALNPFDPDFYLPGVMHACHRYRCAGGALEGRYHANLRQ
jgi:hypothetical protein